MAMMYGPKWAPVKQREQRHPFENEFLSRTEHEGTVYPSAFHAYTAAKCARDRAVFTRGSVRRARELGKGEMVAGFTENRVRVMHSILRSKFFRDPGLARALLATGTDELRYDDKSPFWGYPGTNEHGNILMAVREELRSIVEARREEMEAEAVEAVEAAQAEVEAEGAVEAAQAEVEAAQAEGALGSECASSTGADVAESAESAESANNDDVDDWDPDELSLDASIRALP